MAFTSIGKMIPEHLKHSKVGDALEATAVLSIFMQKAKELWGEAIEQDMKPLYIKNKTLTIAVTNAVLAQELKLHEDSILVFLNKSNDKELVERLRYLL